MNLKKNYGEIWKVYMKELIIKVLEFRVGEKIVKYG